MQLAGKRALVTGGSRGVGAATVLRLAELGASVIVNYLNEKTRADEVVQQAEIFGVTAKPVQADVGNDQDARRLVKETVETLGGLDILVNNAAITRFIDFPDLEDATDEAWASIFETNVYGTFYMTRAAAPHALCADSAVVYHYTASHEPFSQIQLCALAPPKPKELLEERNSCSLRPSHPRSRQTRPRAVPTPAQWQHWQSR